MEEPDAEPIKANATLMGQGEERNKVRTECSPHEHVPAGLHISGLPTVYSASLPSAIPTPLTCWLVPIEHVALRLLNM